MTDPVFLREDLRAAGAVVGGRVDLGGEEGRHAAVVRRIRPGETVVVADGAGFGVRGHVVEAGKSGLAVEVAEVLETPEPPLRLVAVQALAKGDRAELAVEMMTELGVTRIVPWQSARSIVRWTADRQDRGLARWRSTAREAAKQARRLRVPEVTAPVGTAELSRLVAGAASALVLHEEATDWLRDVPLPASGTVLVVIGPEGGIAPEELERLTASGGRAVRISDGVLRTSTAGVVALAGVLLR